MFKIVLLSLVVTAAVSVTAQDAAAASDDSSFTAASAQSARMNCDTFRSFMNDVRAYIKNQDDQNAALEQAGYVINDNIFGAAPTYDTCSISTGQNARLHIVGAQQYQQKYSGSLAQYTTLVLKCNVFEPIPDGCRKTFTTRPKYRAIDGRGNNLNQPEFGASDTPFARFAPKKFEDGVNIVKKAVSGRPLPNPRDLVQNVLKKGVRAAPPPLAYGVFALMTVLFITHDVHYQTPIQPSNQQQEIQCCTADRSQALPAAQSNPSCFPIPIPSNDSFYQGNVGCINLVRSQRAEYIDQVQPGEIMNRATSFLDLSLIYGNHQSELDPIRLNSGGLLRMGKNNVLPVDANGDYIASMRRFTMVPMASIWPSLFAQNHNNLAKRLAVLNPLWDDETLFQESRRINIAIFQYNLITSKAVEASISNIPINENYSSDRNAATSLEFSIAYRMAHYYIHDQMLFKAADNTETRILQSETIGKIELLENNFSPALRGALAEVVNAGPYGDEITNRIGKNAGGFGADIISIDIQRARDQGLPSFLDVRRQCGLGPNITTFDDFKAFLNPANVELLRNAYESPEDVEYYVGGVLETYEILGNPLVGKTFGCVIAKQWDNFAGGDAYYYSNPNSPYPFTQNQIYAIHNYTISNLLCANSDMTETATYWPYAPTDATGPNPVVPCSTFPQMDLSAWQV